eukprot:s1653_g6.t1
MAQFGHNAPIKTLSGTLRHPAHEKGRGKGLQLLRQRLQVAEPLEACVKEGEPYGLPLRGPSLAPTSRSALLDRGRLVFYYQDDDADDGRDDECCCYDDVEEEEECLQNTCFSEAKE